MSGWNRLGLVLSALWGISVIGFAVYEYYRFPIEPFTTYLHRPDYGAYERAKESYFINITETPGIEAISNAERVLWEKYIREAKDDTNRQQLIAARDLVHYSAGVKWGPLVAAMVIPPVFLSLLLVVAAKTVAWIAGGFKPKQ